MRPKTLIRIHKRTLMTCISIQKIKITLSILNSSSYKLPGKQISITFQSKEQFHWYFSALITYRNNANQEQSSSSSCLALQPYESLHLSMDHFCQPTSSSNIYLRLLQISLHKIPPIPGSTTESISHWLIIEETFWYSICIHAIHMANLKVIIIIISIYLFL